MKKLALSILIALSINAFAQDKESLALVSIDSKGLELDNESVAS
jgi:hypothetical protein